MTKIRRLSLKEYRKEEKLFFDRHCEYHNKLCAINRAENDLVNAKTITIEQEEEFENQRNALKEEYKGYTDIYHTDFYTMMNINNIGCFFEDKKTGNFKYFKRDLKKYVGKYVKTQYGETHGICEGIAVTVDDFYYLIRTDNGEVRWFSAVGGISYYTREDRIANRGWCVVTNDKGYL